MRHDFPTPRSPTTTREYRLFQSPRPSDSDRVAQTVSNSVETCCTKSVRTDTGLGRRANLERKYRRNARPGASLDPTKTNAPAPERTCAAVVAISTFAKVDSITVLVCFQNPTRVSL